MSENPTTEQVAEATSWLRARTGSVDDLLYGAAGPETRKHAATLVRAALAETETDITDHAAPEDWHDERFREGWDCAVARLRHSVRAAETETHTEWRITTPKGAQTTVAGEGNPPVFEIWSRQGYRVESRQVTTTRVETPWTEEQT